MNEKQPIKTWKYYAGFLLAIIFLSRCFAGWRHLSLAPSWGTLMELLIAISLFMGTMLYLIFVNYQVEKTKGTLVQPVGIFEKWLGKHG